MRTTTTTSTGTTTGTSTGTATGTAPATVTSRRRGGRTSAALAAAALGLVLAACGDEAAEQPAAGGAGVAVEDVDPTSGAADVTFAQGMIPHHEQAVQMADMALDAAEDPEVVDLAEEISAAQEPEIQTLRTLLEAWGEDVPEPSGGMDHSMGDMAMEGMSGMMSPEDMDALGAAEGAAFDRMWLTMMTEHHEGAVEMAEVELADGENPQAQELAQEIVDTQQAEIARMQELLER